MEISDVSVLDRLLDPLARSLTPDGARAIVNFRADAETQSRIDELAVKSNEGKLSAEEREEYESFVETIDVVAVLQDKARQALERCKDS
jgi:hypothetical protein